MFCSQYIAEMLDYELYPTEIRTHAVGITKALLYFSASSATILFPLMKPLIGLYGVFFYFAVLSTFCAVWGYTKIPETRGKSLVKVEEIYEKK